MFQKKTNPYIAVGKLKVQKVKKLEEGGQATIWLVKDEYGKEYVLKQSTPLVQSAMDQAQREVAIMRKFQHKYIVKYYGDSIHEQMLGGKKVYDVYLLMQYCRGGHLLNYVNTRRQRGQAISEKELLEYAVQIASSIDYLARHRPPIAHRDIKLENVLLSSDGTCKLCDFGSCTTTKVTCDTKEQRVKEEENIDKLTTPFYRAPEMCDLFSGKTISEKVDVWAFGCLLYAMAFGKHAFEDGGKLGILNSQYTFPAGHSSSSDLVSIITWCLTGDPDRRPAIGDVLDCLEEVLHGKISGQDAEHRGSGCGARPASQAVNDDEVEKKLAGQGSGAKSPSRRRKSTKDSPIPTPQAAPSRNRTPSAALRARLAKRNSTASTNTAQTRAQSKPASSSASFNPFNDSNGTVSQANPASGGSADLLGLNQVTQHSTPPLPPSNDSTPQPSAALPMTINQQLQQLSMSSQDQQPMMANQQQPMMMNQQQPMMMNQQQPMMMNQQQPMMMNQQQPMTMNQQQPMMMNQQQHMMMNQQQQHMMAMNQQQPMMVNQHQQMQQNPTSFMQQTQPPPGNRQRTGSSSSNPFDTLEHTGSEPNMAPVPLSLSPQFFSNPGMSSSSFSGFPVDEELADTAIPPSQQPQFFSNPGTFR